MLGSWFGRVSGVKVDGEYLGVGYSEQGFHSEGVRMDEGNDQLWLEGTTIMALEM